MVRGARIISRAHDYSIFSRRSALAWQHSSLKNAVDRQRLRPHAGGEYALQKFIAPVPGEAAVSDAEGDGGSDFVEIAQLELGKPRSNIGLSHKYSKARVLIEVIAIGVQQNWLIAIAENFECQRISM